MNEADREIVRAERDALGEGVGSDGGVVADLSQRRGHGGEPGASAPGALPGFADRGLAGIADLHVEGDELAVDGDIDLEMGSWVNNSKARGRARRRHRVRNGSCADLFQIYNVLGARARTQCKSICALGALHGPAAVYAEVHAGHGCSSDECRPKVHDARTNPKNVTSTAPPSTRRPSGIRTAPPAPRQRHHEEAQEQSEADEPLREDHLPQVALGPERRHTALRAVGSGGARDRGEAALDVARAAEPDGR